MSLKIEISGMSGNGAGSIAKLIQKTLLDHGIGCTVSDPVFSKFDQTIESFLPRTLNSLTEKNLQVAINVVQLPLNYEDPT